MDGTLDTTWKALSDPTRREVLDLLRGGPKTTGELASAFEGLSRYAVMKHLGVLVDAGLVVSRKEGRKRWNYLNAVPLRQVYERWVSRYEDMWAGSLIGLKQVAEESATEATMATLKEAGEARVAVIEEEITVEADRDRVFTALTDDIGQWFWCGEKNEQPPVKLEPWAGGRFYREWDGGASELYGIVELVSPGKALRLNGSIGGTRAIASLTTIKLEESDGATVVSMTHRMAGELAEEDMVDYKAGWADELSSMKRYVETGVGRREAD